MKLKNKLRIITLIIIFILTTFTVISHASTTGTITEVTVNVRKEPSTSSARLRMGYSR